MRGTLRCRSAWSIHAWVGGSTQCRGAADCCRYLLQPPELHWCLVEHNMNNLTRTQRGRSCLVSRRSNHIQRQTRF